MLHYQSMQDGCLTEQKEKFTRIQSLPLDDALAVYDELSTYITDFPHAEVKKMVRDVSVLFHRRWILTSIHGHLHKVRRARECARDTRSRTAYERNLELAGLWLGQAEKLVKTIAFFTGIDTTDAKRFRMSSEELQRGDIILSYKTSYYLKRSPLSWLVKFATNSPVTHVGIVAHARGEPAELLVSGDITRGLGIITPIPESGEIFLILRNADVRENERVLEAIEAWRIRAKTRNDTTAFTNVDPYPFPELKCQIASGIGLLTVLSSYLGLPCSLPNPAYRSRGVFCSELIDVIYKEAGVLLSPRSEHGAVIGPIEFLYSPKLVLTGMIARDEDLVELNTEIHKQFIGY